ncbi:MAG: hypothetical protein P1U86_04865 [Verrucomicrobiales bacterium]|nr:hypothetical protein [Verrucomicrobiales bacterium]
MAVAAESAFSEDEVGAHSGDFLPRPIDAESFTDLKGVSPFRRSIDFSDSIVLTGMARIEGNVYATLFDSESTLSYVVSENTNTEGWQLVGVRGDETDLESLTAKIQVNGGEVVSIRYAKVERQSASGSGGGSSRGGGGSLSQEQIDDARRAGRNPAEGFRGDGYRGSPPPEVMEKLNKISAQQREELARRVMEMRNNGVNSDERRRIYSEALDRAARGR